MTLNELRRKIKRNRLIFFTYKKMTDPDYRSNYKDYTQSVCSKSKEKVKEELKQVKDFWKCDPMHYFRYRLYEKDLTYEELIDYVPAYYFYNYHMDILYGESDIRVTESKILMREFFLLKGIKTPLSVALVKNGKIYSTSGDNMSFEKLISHLRSSAAATFFVKPDRGRGGNGIFTIRKSADQLYSGNELLNERSFMTRVRQNDFLIQEGIVQRSDINSINSSSVNTLRVVTQLENNSVRLSAVVLRIGRNNSFVDNSTQGGISVNIDSESGTMSKYAFTEHKMEKFVKQPDTGFVFEGFVLRDWEKIRTSIKEYAKKTPEFPEIAWDIAVQEDGISVIEINVNYGIDHLQCCIGGMRRRLNINPVMIGNTVC
jgi:hypothetical protein